MRTAWTLALVLAVFAAAPAQAASIFTASSRVDGEVADRDTTAVYGSFELDSQSVGSPDLSGSAEEPGGAAESAADVDFQTVPITGGERLAAQGSASANTGHPTPREVQSTSHVTAEFALTGPARYTATGSLGRSAVQCCAGSQARLLDDDGNEVFEVVVSSSDPPRNVASSGTLPPGEYRFDVESSVGFGFGAAANIDITGSASFDVALALTLLGADTDGDALPDNWETDGVDVDGNGSIDLDLPGMGADPRRKDLFVELDFMPPHRFDAAAAAQIVDAFADAPVGNPDGSSGIALHLDNGSDSVMNPKTGATWGSRSRQSSLVHQDVLGALAGGDYDWTAFDDLRTVAFPQERRSVFRYAISAHGHDGRVSGVARGIPSSDLLVTLGAGCAFLNGGVDCTLTPTAQAGTLMHELGHTLGLRHGGGDDVLNKPNHLSVMNYSFQLTGLQDTSGNRFLDYSRFSIPLDERALNESQGFGITADPPANLLTVGRCPDGTRVAWPIKAGPLDFNCDRAFGPASADVSGDGLQTALTPFTDWPALVFAGGSVGGAGAIPPTTTPRNEPALDELVTAKAALDAALPQPSQPAAPGPGGGAAPPPGGAAVKPRLTALAVRPGTFRARRGAHISYTLTAPARVRFTLERLLPGHRRGGRCRAGGRGPRCVRSVRVTGSFSHTGRAGANRLRLPAKLAGRRLKAGRYRLVATPAGGAARRAAFKIR